MRNEMKGHWALGIGRSSKVRSTNFLLGFALTLLFTSALAQRKIEPQGGYWVHDEAGVLSPETKGQLETFIRNEEDSTSNQIAVYIIPSLDGEDIDDYAFKVFKEWKIGTAEKDNGVLMLIAIDDRLMRIEVGKGLEGVLTDVTSARIRRHDVNPYFQQGDYESGVKAGVVSIAQAIRGEYTNEEEPRPLKTSRKRGSPLITLLFIIILIIISRRRGGGGGGGRGLSRGIWMLPMMMGGMGRSGGGGWSGGGGSWGGGGMSGGGGSSGSW